MIFPFELVQNCDDLRTHQTAVRTISFRCHFWIGCSASIHTSPDLTGSTLRALRAESAENKLTFTNNSLAQRTRGRFGHVVPVDVLNIAAAVTDEVVMAHAFQV